MIKLRHLIQNLYVIDERLETMRKSLGNVKRTPVVCRQLYCVPFSCGSGSLTQIDDDVPDCAARAAHQLCFRVWFCLEMKPAKRTTLAVEGDIALGYRRIKTPCPEFILTKRPRKEATLILKQLQLNKVGPSEG